MSVGAAWRGDTCARADRPVGTGGDRGPDRSPRGERSRDLQPAHGASGGLT
ncbi:hypothetical protein JYU34_010774 [Plutella xylostella]|uniref:Uncharacterized protein n=1 Tax=Plutella xylostella TaxID=51655 RepID=A0ABQ7QF71_PLUXY|nr:hypothetical protein JYU34_010774 [Plutella xylostella]